MLTPSRTPSPAALARAALALVGAGLVSVVALQALERRLDPLTTYLSDYESSPHGWLIQVAYVAMGAGSVLLAAAVRLGARESRPLATGSTLIGVAGALVLAFAAWPQGFVHLSLVRASQGVMLVGIGFLAVGLREPRRRSAFEALSWTLVGLAALGLLRAEQLFPWPGLVQRAYFALVLAWVALLARAVLALEGRAYSVSGHQNAAASQQSER